MCVLRRIGGRASREVGGFGRFRCRSASCGRTFHALTGTHLAGLKHKSKWPAFEECLRDRLTLHQSAERCGVSHRTAFLWRHRFLDQEERQGSSLQGIVEMDETYFLESCKGDRSLRKRRLRRESWTQRPGVGAAARPDGRISRRTDPCGDTPVDGGCSHHSGDVRLARRRLHLCHRWPPELPGGKPEPEHSSGSGSLQPGGVAPRKMASQHR